MGVHHSASGEFFVFRFFSVSLSTPITKNSLVGCFTGPGGGRYRRSTYWSIQLEDARLDATKARGVYLLFLVECVCRW